MLPGGNPEWEACWDPAWPLCATVRNNSQFRPFNASLRDVLTGRAFEGHLVHISLHPGSLSHIYVFTLCLLVQEGGRGGSFQSELDEKGEENLASGVAGSSSLKSSQSQVSDYL